MNEANSEHSWLSRELGELRKRETKYREQLSRQEAEAARLREYAHSLHQLLHRRPPLRHELPSTLMAVARLSSQALRVERASVWFFDAAQRTLSSAVQLDGEVAVVEPHVSLESASCPTYVRALAQQNAVAVRDVYDDPRTQELAPYLREHHISALLDIPIVIPGQLIGVVRLEHVGGPRMWQHGEIELASNVGHLVALALETERRLNAEYAARGTEAKYQYLVESLPVTVYSFDAQTGRLVYVSPQAFKFGGQSAQRWLEQGAGPWLHRIHPDDRAQVRLRFERGAAGGFPEEVTYRVTLDDDRIHYIRDTCHVVRDVSGEAIAIQGVLADVTESSETQLARDEMERRYRAVLKNVDVIAVSLDVQGRVTFANDAFVRVSGYAREQLIGLDWFEVALAPELRESVRNRFLRDMARNNVVPRFELAIKTRSGQTRQLMSTNTLLRSGDGKTQGTLSLALDVTDRRNLEAQLMQQTKLESLGRLAAGVAHDFNNLLAVMLGQLELLKARFAGESGSATAAVFDALGGAVDQAAELTRSLLLYGRRQVSRIETFELDGLVRESMPLLEALASGGLHVSASLQGQCTQLSLDRSQIRQVLINLVGNAADATRGHGTSIRIATHLELLDDAVARSKGGAGAGEYVVLSVADDGRGMDTATLARAFDPFFTTKPDGRGTGLGLAVVHTVVSQSGGFIDAQSDLGKGTTFRAYFPVRGRRSQTASAAPANDRTATSRAAVRVLVVEDLAPIREMITDTLRRAGYDVFAATDRRSAAEVLGSIPIDLLVTDLHLPDGSGEVLARSARSVQPLRVVLMSGNAEVEESFDGVLTKPFDSATLLRVVANALAI
jgi:PAS domain S-box-containing protein